MDYCENSIYENIGDIQNEINNYKEFKKELLDFLEKNPIIKYSTFIKNLFHFIKINIYLI